VKVSVIVTCVSLLPASLQITWGPRNDCCEVPVLLARAYGRIHPTTLYADAGYDAEWIHRWLSGALAGAKRHSGVRAGDSRIHPRRIHRHRFVGRRPQLAENRRQNAINEIRAHTAIGKLLERPVVRHLLKSHRFPQPIAGVQELADATIGLLEISLEHQARHELRLRKYVLASGTRIRGQMTATDRHRKAADFDE